MEFKYGDSVQVTSGFYEGVTGKICDKGGFYEGNHHFLVKIDNPIIPDRPCCDCTADILKKL